MKLSDNLSERYPGCTSFTVRLWDMMDGWIDVAPNLSAQEAMERWSKETRGGTRNTEYSDGDYWDIFPANTRMVYTPEFLGR